MKAIERVPTAAMQVGSILLIKYEVSGKPLVQVRTLTQRELIQLEKNQDLLKSPADILERLSELCHRGSRSAKNARQQNGIDPGPSRVPLRLPDKVSVRRGEQKPSRPDEGMPRLGLSHGTADTGQSGEEPIQKSCYIRTGIESRRLTLR
jgi:hypothetical protein